MNERKDKYLKLDKASYAQELADIKRRQKAGLYPEAFYLPLGVQFELTAKCNLACRHCYNDSRADRDSIMTVENWLKVVEDINSKGGIFQCILSGGEPLLLGKDLFRIMQPLADAGTGFVLITNGLLVNQEFVDRISAFDFYWVQVSIDHLLPQEHDAFRGRTGSWERAVRAALMFSAAGLPLRIAHSITPTSLKYLEDFADFAYELGASSLICGEVMLSGRVEENRELLFSDQDLDTLYGKIEELQKKYVGKMEIFRSANECLALRQRQRTPNTSCIIRPDGAVRLDCTMPAVIGNVLQKPFTEIWEKHGNTCWLDSRVDAYIANLEEKGYDIDHVNHMVPDLFLGEKE